jgi:hypothetical protein
MAKKKKNTKDEWISGFACACAILAKDDGYVGSGKELAKNGGFNLKSLKEAKIEKIDLQDLIKDGLI